MLRPTLASRTNRPFAPRFEPGARRSAAAVAAVALAAFAGGAAALLVAPREAAAQEDENAADEAKRLYEQGVDLYSRGSYDEAIASWERSNKLKPWVKLKKFMADGFEKLGKSADLRKSAALLREYESQAPEEEREALRNRIKKLESRADEREKAEKGGGTKIIEKKVFVPRKEEPPAAPVLGIVLTGAGVVTVGTGLALGLLASGRRPDPAEVCRDSSGKQLCQSSARDSIDSSSRLALISDVTWITGAVVTGVGIVLIAMHPKKSASAAKETSALRFVPTVGTRGGGAFLRGAF